MPGNHRDLILIKNNTVSVLASNANGIHVLDIKNPSKISLISRIETDNFANFVTTNALESILCAS